MKAKPQAHAFTPKTYALYEGCICFNCMLEEKGACTSDCLHHIFSRVSNSPFNAAPMNNNKCHINDGDKMGGHTRHLMYERKQMYLRFAITWLHSRCYKMTKKDKAFLEKYADAESLGLIDLKF